MAGSAGLKAQYRMSTEGREPEYGAMKAAEKAVAGMNPNATPAQKVAMAKMAGTMYMKQDEERKKSMIMLDKAIEALGPMKKVKANPALHEAVTKVHDVLNAPPAVPTEADGGNCD